jgi:hypothetical protein
MCQSLATGWQSMHSHSPDTSKQAGTEQRNSATETGTRASVRRSASTTRLAVAIAVVRCSAAIRSWRLRSVWSRWRRGVLLGGLGAALRDLRLVRVVLRQLARPLDDHEQHHRRDDDLPARCAAPYRLPW